MQTQTRREFLRRAGLATAAFGQIGLESKISGANQLRTGRPNILFVICDQLNPGALSCYGGPVDTPNIDQIAAEGIRFTQATCTTPFCSPTRASIVTGMYPHAHGVVLNANPARQIGIGRDDTTTEKLLNQAGYRTHHYGKWHLEGDELPCYPDMFRSGLEYKEKMAPVFEKVRRQDKATWMNWYGWALPVEISAALQKQVDALGDRWKDKRFAEFITKMGRLKLPLEQCLDVQVADLTCSRLRTLQNKNDPFMITCSFTWPHDPNVAPSPYYEAFDPAKIRLPANRHVREKRFEKNWSREIVRALGEPGLREFLRVYYAMVKLIDDQVGRILETLNALGKMDDTIIIFTADHGDMMGGHGMVWKSTSAFYEEVVRVPLLVRYPRKFKPQLSDLAADSTDLMPTLLELTGHPIGRQVQGQSLVPFLTAARDPSEARRYTYCERVRPHPQGRRKVLPGTKGDFMIRGNGWKFIRYRDGQEYLYNLRQDPTETTNLVDDPKCRSRREELAAEINEWLRRTGWPG
ncbi:MAG: sulfatase-like hydrolase/transferase [Phycisphaerales bacterium]|nr:MAG: sulfatase-like hydrolase/transferase [Phycisphaerales bacterium]